MTEAKEETLDWLIGCSDIKERDDFLRRIFMALPEEGLKRCLSLISKTRKHRKALEATHKAVVGPQIEEEDAASAWSEHSNVSAPVMLASSGWLSEWRKEDVVGIDVEKVEVPLAEPTKKKKYDQKAGLVSLVDAEGNVLLKEWIYRDKGSYRVTEPTMAINGISSTSLQDPQCKPLEEVIHKIHNIIVGKLVVGLELKNDFNSLDMAIGDYKVFDLQSHYYRLSFSVNHKRIVDKLGLRSLCKHFFGIDIQPAGRIHDVITDAVYSVKLFIDAYCKIEPPPQEKDENEVGTNEIPHFH